MRKILFSFILVFFIAVSMFNIFPIGEAGFVAPKGDRSPVIIPSDNASYSLMVNGTYQAYFKNNSKTTNSVRFQNKGYTFDMDISRVARQFMTTENSTNWLPQPDIYEPLDGKVDMRDIGTVVRHFGEIVE